MAVTFKPRFAWPENELLLRPAEFGVSVPKGLDASHVRHPIFVDDAELMRRVGKSALPTVKGLVTADLSIAFADPARQWAKSPVAAAGATHGPWKFSFTGGDVFLDLDLAIHVASSVRYDPDDELSVAIFATVYEHELLHVLDDIDILTRWLPSHLRAEPTVARYLVEGKPYVYGSAKSSTMEKDFADFIAYFIKVNLIDVWAMERNRRGARRDDPDEYRIVQDKVDALRIKQINRR